MSGPHLAARVTPLVDGRLAADAELRVEEHLRTCCECHEAVEAERLVRARLAALPAPEVSHDLMARLLDIGGPSGPLPPRDRQMAVPARPVTGIAPPSRTDRQRPSTQRPSTQRPSGARPGARVRVLRRRPVALALAGTFSLLGAGLVGVLVLGGLPGGAPSPVAEFRPSPSASVSSPASSTTTDPPVTGSPAMTQGPSTTTPTP